MKLAAIVPLNRLSHAKTRLTDVLDAGGRAALSRWLARRVLVALQRAEIAHIGVVSPDEDVLRWAWQSGAQPIRQQDSGLNHALESGRAWALHADALLIALGDLPLLTPEDVREMTRVAANDDAQRSVVIATDRAAQGTNMLLLRPPSAIRFAFGENSLARHLALAREAGIEPRILQLPGAAFDVDTPDDLRELAERGLWRPSERHPQFWAGEAS